MFCFQAETADALETITHTVFDGVCTANAAKAISSQSKLSAPTTWTPDNVFLLQAAGQYLDVFGTLPVWTPGYQQWLNTGNRTIP